MRLRAKSTATAMLGMDMGGMPQQDGQPQQPQKKPGVRAAEGHPRRRLSVRREAARMARTPRHFFSRPAMPYLQLELFPVAATCSRVANARWKRPARCR